jgi:hypothetical protein
MALNIPTTKELKDQFLANYEEKINQNSPLNDKSFLRVQSGNEALTITQLYRYGVERSLQNFALTATGADLDIIGNTFNITRKPAEKAELIVELPATDSTVIPAYVNFVGDSNGERYFPTASAIASGGYATITVFAERVGTRGNLNVGETMTMDTEIAGAELVATITVVENVGIEEETDASYRPRVLFALRAITGGSNPTDYKIWAEEVAGVKTAFPFSGKPFNLFLTSYPGDRVVYIEVETTIDPDGIAPQATLDEVREYLKTNPTTGKARYPLGITDETLYVESIRRDNIYIEIRNLEISSTDEAIGKENINSALTQYFLELENFVPGIDIIQERNDTISDVKLGDIIQDVLEVYGASASSVGFGLTPGSFVSKYTLEPGQKTKLGGIVYA